MELWRDIKGYEGLYQISHLGRVKSLARTWDGYRGSRRTKEETILKPSHSRKYEIVELSKFGYQKIFYVHRLVAFHFRHNPLDLREVNHEDGNPTNNTASNLKWCDKNYNMDHAKRTGLIIGKPGSKNPAAKLTEADIPVIRNRRNTGEHYSSIAASYRVDQSTIYSIIKGKKWNHV